MSESSGGSQAASEAGGLPPSPGRPPTAVVHVSSARPPDQQSLGSCDSDVGSRFSEHTLNNGQFPPDEKSPTQKTTVREGGGSGGSKMTLVTGMMDSDDDLFCDAQDNIESINGSGMPKLQKRRKEEHCSNLEIQEGKKQLQREQKKQVPKSDQLQKPVVADTEDHSLSESDRQRVGRTGEGACAPEGQVI